MVKISVVYHSGFGHTAPQARAVVDGAKSVTGAEVHLIRAEDVDRHWDVLNSSDAIVFGSPTYRERSPDR